MSVNRETLADLILYLGKSPLVENLGKTKLWKLIYFTDAAFLREHGQSLTHSEYIRYDHGPVPSRGEKLLKTLGREGLVSVKQVDYGSFRQHHVTTVRESGLGFSPEDRELIDRVCRRYGRSTATYLSEISHLEPSWANAGKMDKLSPELMHYGYQEDEEGL